MSALNYNNKNNNPIRDVLLKSYSLDGNLPDVVQKKI